MPTITSTRPAGAELFLACCPSPKPLRRIMGARVYCMYEQNYVAGTSDGIARTSVSRRWRTTRRSDCATRLSVHKLTLRTRWLFACCDATWFAMASQICVRKVHVPCPIREGAGPFEKDQGTRRIRSVASVSRNVPGPSPRGNSLESRFCSHS